MINETEKTGDEIEYSRRERKIKKWFSRPYKLSRAETFTIFANFIPFRESKCLWKFLKGQFAKVCTRKMFQSIIRESLCSFTVFIRVKKDCCVYWKFFLKSFFPNLPHSRKFKLEKKIETPKSRKFAKIIFSSNSRK